MGELTCEVIDAAAQGDRAAIEEIVAHYAGEIDALCTRKGRRRDGTVVTHIDEDMRHEVVRRLIADLPNIAARLRAQAEAGAAETAEGARA